MTVKEIEEKYGLPVCIARTHHDGTVIKRTLTRKLEDGHYMQVDEKQPHLGEFQHCYTKGLSERVANDWEYQGKPPESADTPF